MTENVKDRLANKLAELLIDHPIYKITIKELADSVGINRQTFYYHFSDIYDLALYMFKGKISNLIHTYSSSTNFNDIIYKVFHFAIENRNLFLNAISKLDYQIVNTYMSKIVSTLVTFAIKTKASQLNKPLEPNYLKELVTMLTCYINYQLLDWFKSGQDSLAENKMETIANLITFALESNIIHMSNIIKGEE